jgi:hypothetical protein
MTALAIGLLRGGFCVLLIAAMESAMNRAPKRSADDS